MRAKYLGCSEKAPFRQVVGLGKCGGLPRDEERIRGQWAYGPPQAPRSHCVTTAAQEDVSKVLLRNCLSICKTLMACLALPGEWHAPYSTGNTNQRDYGVCERGFEPITFVAMPSNTDDCRRTSHNQSLCSTGPADHFHVHGYTIRLKSNFLSYCREPSTCPDN